MLAWNFTALCGVVLWKGEMMHPRPSVREGCYYLFPQQVFGRSIILRVLEVMEPSTEILRGAFEGRFEEPGLWCQFPTERMIQPYLVLFLTVSVSAARTRGRFSWHWPLAIIQSRTKTLLGFWAQLLNQLPDAAYCQLFKRSSWPLSRPCRLPDLRDPFSGVEDLDPRAAARFLPEVILEFGICPLLPAFLCTRPPLWSSSGSSLTLLNIWARAGHCLASNGQVEKLLSQTLEGEEASKCLSTEPYTCTHTP